MELGSLMYETACSYIFIEKTCNNQQRKQHFRSTSWTFTHNSLWEGSDGAWLCKVSVRTPAVQRELRFREKLNHSVLSLWELLIYPAVLAQRDHPVPGWRWECNLYRGSNQKRGRKTLPILMGDSFIGPVGRWVDVYYAQSSHSRPLHNFFLHQQTLVAINNKRA